MNEAIALTAAIVNIKFCNKKILDPNRNSNPETSDYH